MSNRSGQTAVLPPQLIVGLLLVGVCWPLNWGLSGLRTQLLFFPLWLGYVLTVDGIVFLRRGTSILARSRRSYWTLFLGSISVWWLFELLNERLANWTYVGREHFGDFEYAILGSLSFSTVMPAVFETADLLWGADWIQRTKRGPKIDVTRRFLSRWFVLGIVMLTLLIAFPRYCYPFTWVALLFLCEPVCRWMGRRSLLTHLEVGDWRPVVSLAFGAITCGFFWEMWNYWSYPKWVYSTPGVEFLYLFEMPALGYFGYLPFGLELYAMAGLIFRRPVPLFDSKPVNGSAPDRLP